MSQRSPIRLVYIAGMGHSGSTLLDLLVSSHSRVVSVGEAHRFGRDLAPNCTCEAANVWECRFWTEVAAAFEAATGTPLRSARLGSGGDREFSQHNLAFLEAVRRVSGKEVIVDSSKSLPRLRRLLASGAFEVFPVHIVRRPEGVAFSNVRKGRSWASAAWDHGRRFRLAQRVLRGREHVVVHYEDLAARPAEVLRDLMERIGLDFEPAQLSWAGRARHNCGGNRMRRTAEAKIRLDLAWQTGFRRWQRFAIVALALAGRCSPPVLRSPAPRRGRSVSEQNGLTAGSPT